ncbi:hypothetical protein BDA99DRAFT_522189 [Phascolomyces articulosus]|uniref:Uncharacterized protein n=1 Tax=Phascolomyces articulosus TaxID=60185 RepID=A0AAD5K1L9_9FUNG|nr:hypothetical protein BDA99DRAFT_522189 [Phascolomyces articulosus]
MFNNNKQHFQFEDIPDLSGKIAIVTGSTSGIGKPCAIELARKGCTLVLPCRNESKGESLVKEIKEKTGNEKVEYIPLDLASLESVKNFVEIFLSKYYQLHILLNNAGMMPVGPFDRTEDGFETMFGVNVIATHYLMIQLLPILEKSTPSRIVNVASNAHWITSLVRSIIFERMNDESYFNRFLQYGRSKAVLMLLSFELDRRLRSKGIDNLYVNTNHPGAVKNGPYYEKVKANSLFDQAMDLFFVTPEEGALTQLYLATSPEVEEKNIHSQYYVPIAQPGSTSAYTKSEKEATKAWELVEELIKEKMPGYPGAHI